jgi:DNA-binding IclR family transcriptional regulator
MANSSFRMHVAFRPLSEQLKILRSGVHGSMVETADIDAILKRMEEERREGLGYDMEEQDKGVCAASAPVLERDGSLKAVLTLVAPAERFGPRARKKKVDALRSAAAEMTKYLGGRALNG